MSDLCIFTREEINTGRQIEFDLAKVLCLLAMVFCHVYEEIGVSGGEGVLYYFIVVVLNGMFGATLFMQCMGFGFAYSRTNDPKLIMKRGLGIFILGYILNIIRFVLPIFIACKITGYTIDAGYYIQEALMTDIMQFAGLAMILFGALKALKLKDWIILLISIAMGFASLFIHIQMDGHVALSCLVSLFFRTSQLQSEYEYSFSFFPFFSWFVVVIVGYFYAKLIKRLNNPKKYYAIASVVSGIIVLIALIIMIPNRIGLLGTDLETSFYPMALYYVPLVFVSFVFDTSICYFISLLFNDKIKKFISGISSNINSIYCIQWVFIGWIAVFFASYEGFNEIVLCVLALVVFVLAVVLSILYKKVLKRIKEKKAKKLQNQA